MAMGNYCYAQGIECSYATTCGDCLDSIYEDYGLCEMLGDDMPPRELSVEDRIEWIVSKQKQTFKR